jgi:DNA-binding protein H-NS
MASVNLSTMDVDALLELRGEIDSALAERSRELRAQLARLDGGRKNGGGRSAGTSALKGLKVPPKYQGPDGETWAGRGARPKWLTALLDQGHDIEEFAVGGASDDVEEAEEVVKPARAKRGAKKGGRRKAA